MTTPLREILARFGVVVNDRPLVQANRRISATRASLRGLVAAAGGAAMVHGFRRFVTGSIAIGDNIDKVSQQIGLSTTEFQAFGHAAALGGVNASAFANSMGQLQQRAVQAARDGGQTARAFEQLGVSVVDSAGEVVEGGELLRRVADGLENTDNAAERTALSMELMGRSGRQMLPMLIRGRAGLEAMTDELEALGGGASQLFIDQSVQLTDEITRFDVSMMGLRANVATALLPTLTRSVKWLTKMSVAMSRSQRVAASATPILVGLGAAAAAAGVSAAIAWGSVIAPVTAAAAIFAGLYLVTDDIWVGMRGGKSLIGEVGNEFGTLFGIVNLGTNALNGMYMAAQALLELLGGAVGAFAGFYQIPATLSGDVMVQSNQAGANIRDQMDSAAGSFWRSIPGMSGLADRAFGQESPEVRRRRDESQAQFDASAATNVERAQPIDHAQRARDARQARDSAWSQWQATSAGNPALWQPTAARAGVSQAPQQNVSTGDSTYNISVVEATNAEDTAKLVRMEIAKANAADNRAVLAALEPSLEVTAP